MQKIDSKIINTLPKDELLKLWNSGLGPSFCENNNDDIDVKSISKNIIHYKKKGKNSLISSLLWLLISVFVFSIVYSAVNYVDLENVGILAIISGVVCFIFLLGSAKRILKAIKLYDSAKKLSNYDLSGFDIEEYVPSKKRLLIKSVEWGIAKGKLTIRNDEIESI